MNLLPTSPAKNLQTHYRAITFHISSAQNKEANILFSKHNNYKKNPSSSKSHLIKNISKDPAVSVSNIQTGLMNYLLFPDSREKALVRLFLDQISAAVVQIQMLAL